jgi:DNA-directed RNA polymerase alpha subunit
MNDSVPQNILEILQRREEYERAIRDLEKRILRLRESRHSFYQENAQAIIVLSALEIDTTPLAAIGLSERITNTLCRSDINTVADIIELIGRGTDSLLAIRNFGKISIDQLLECLIVYVNAKSEAAE